MGEVLVDFNQDRLATLPDEILVEVFSFLDAKDLYSMSLLGRYWHNLSEGNSPARSQPNTTMSNLSGGSYPLFLHRGHPMEEIDPELLFERKDWLHP